ncbi:hypothetical protein ZWY2020_033396 [Hordeum vulgare]|nr:hypothetical protein ZWY2020_033396 [Hordeum vulgare]
MVNVHRLHPLPRLERNGASAPTPCSRFALHEALRVAPWATLHRLADRWIEPPRAVARPSHARSARPQRLGPEAEATAVSPLPPGPRTTPAIVGAAPARPAEPAELVRQIRPCVAQRGAPRHPPLIQVGLCRRAPQAAARSWGRAWWGVAGAGGFPVSPERGNAGSG